MEKSPKVHLKSQSWGGLGNACAFSLFNCVISPDLIDAMELERTAANLNKELTASREAEEALKGQLASLQVLPDQVQHLVKQVGFLTFLRTSFPPPKVFIDDEQLNLNCSWSRVNSKNRHWKNK